MTISTSPPGPFMRSSLAGGGALAPRRHAHRPECKPLYNSCTGWHSGRTAIPWLCLAVDFLGSGCSRAHRLWHLGRHIHVQCHVRPWLTPCATYLLLSGPRYSEVNSNVGIVKSSLSIPYKRNLYGIISFASIQLLISEYLGLPPRPTTPVVHDAAVRPGISFSTRLHTVPGRPR